MAAAGALGDDSWGRRHGGIPGVRGVDVSAQRSRPTASGGPRCYSGAPQVGRGAPDLASRTPDQPVDARYGWFVTHAFFTAETLWSLVGDDREYPDSRAPASFHRGCACRRLRSRLMQPDMASGRGRPVPLRVLCGVPVPGPGGHPVRGVPVLSRRSAARAAPFQSRESLPADRGSSPESPCAPDERGSQARKRLLTVISPISLSSTSFPSSHSRNTVLSSMA